MNGKKSFIQFSGAPGLNDNIYKSLAWVGLANIKDANGEHDVIYTEAWKTLSVSEQNSIIETIKNEKENGNKTCEE